MRNLALVFMALVAEHAAAAAESTERVLDFEAEDVAAVTWSGPSVVVQLTPSAAAHLAKATGEHVGRMLEVRIDGIPAARATVMGRIDSGTVSVARPSDRLRRRLEEIERALVAPRFVPRAPGPAGVASGRG